MTPSIRKKRTSGIQAAVRFSGINEIRAVMDRACKQGYRPYELKPTDVIEN
jgi:hypothetical protein